jgi:hypothetical protein
LYLYARGRAIESLQGKFGKKGARISMAIGLGRKMAKDKEYYSVNEVKKSANKRVYHDNDQCRAGREIPPSERRDGTGGYRHCEDCDT